MIRSSLDSAYCGRLFFFVVVSTKKSQVDGDQIKINIRIATGHPVTDLARPSGIHGNDEKKSNKYLFSPKKNTTTTAIAREHVKGKKMKRK